jgi:hypothetical protein
MAVNGLRPALRQYALSVDPNLVIKSGATAILSNIPVAAKAGVLSAYNKALRATFVGMSSLTVISSTKLTRSGYLLSLALLLSSSAQDSFGQGQDQRRIRSHRLRIMRKMVLIL